MQLGINRMTTVSPYSITGGRLFFSRRDAPARYSAAPAHSFSRSAVIEVTSSLWGQPNYEQFVVGKWVTLFCSE
jgi:hypothetical protein